MATGSSSPKSFPAAELCEAVGVEPLPWEARPSAGYGTNTCRWRVELAEGRRAFVKLALDEAAAGWLRDEHAVYAAVQGSFLPRLLGWYDDGATFLVLEDLSDAYWPPPWRHGDVEAVRVALEAVHASHPPRGLRA